jgi:hypothetical protein
MAAWRSYFEVPLPSAQIIKSILILLGHQVVLISIAIIKFNSKDITS